MVKLSDRCSGTTLCYASVCVYEMVLISGLKKKTENEKKRGMEGKRKR